VGDSGLVAFGRDFNIQPGNISTDLQPDLPTRGRPIEFSSCIDMTPELRKSFTCVFRLSRRIASTSPSDQRRLAISLLCVISWHLATSGELDSRLGFAALCAREAT
jgi:hypothetical protein